MCMHVNLKQVINSAHQIILRPQSCKTSFWSFSKRKAFSFGLTKCVPGWVTSLRANRALSARREVRGAPDLPESTSGVGVSSQRALRKVPDLPESTSGVPLGGQGRPRTPREHFGPSVLSGSSRHKKANLLSLRRSCFGICKVDVRNPWELTKKQTF